MNQKNRVHYHLNIIDDTLRLAAIQNFGANKFHEGRLRLTNVLDNLLVDPRFDTAIHYHLRFPWRNIQKLQLKSV